MVEILLLQTYHYLVIDCFPLNDFRNCYHNFKWRHHLLFYICTAICITLGRVILNPLSFSTKFHRKVWCCGIMCPNNPWGLCWMPRFTSTHLLKLRKPDPENFAVNLMFKVEASLAVWPPRSYVAMPNVVHSMLLTFSSVSYIIWCPIHIGLTRTFWFQHQKSHPGQIRTAERLYFSTKKSDIPRNPSLPGKHIYLVIL